MRSLIKFHSFWRFHILQTTKHCESLMYASTNVKKSIIKKTNLVQRRKKSKLYIPDLKEIKLEVLNNFTSISLGLNSVSWAKISISNLALLEWSSYQLPLTFQSQMNELEILKLAGKIKQLIPSSDLYVLESQKKWKSTVNEMYLRTSLITNLNKVDKGTENNDKLLIQDCEILNILYDLTVGWERKSAKKIVEKIYNNSNYPKHIADDISNLNSLVEISEMQMLSFFKGSIVKQESLSLALLMAVSFIDVIVLKNAVSRLKILKKLKVKI